jgi:hypothetical protein
MTRDRQSGVDHFFSATINDTGPDDAFRSRSFSPLFDFFLSLQSGVVTVQCIRF